MIATCLEHGITPVVTYCHFTTPRWFAGEGGWAGRRRRRTASPATPTRATEHLGDLLGWVATLNEPNVMTMLELTGVIPMGVERAGRWRADASRRRPASAATTRRATGWA